MALIDFTTSESQREIAEARRWAIDNGVVPFEYGHEKDHHCGPVSWVKFANTDIHRTTEMSLRALIDFCKRTCRRKLVKQ